MNAMTPMFVLSHAILRTKTTIIAFGDREREIQPRAIIVGKHNRHFVHATENGKWRLFPVDKIQNAECFERPFVAHHYKAPEWATVKTVRVV